MEKAHQRIKPLFPLIIHIKSFSTLRDLFIRRPKQTVSFKFTRQYNSDGKDPAKIELKLQKAFRFLKSVKKIDLHQFQRRPITHQRLKSYFKHFSKASTMLLATKYSSERQLSFSKQSVKYLCRVSTLSIESGGKRLSDPVLDSINENPLSNSKYYPRAQSLRYLAPWRGFQFVKAGQKDPIFLKHLVILAMPEKGDGFTSFFQRLVNLESVYLKLYCGSDADTDVILQSLEGLSRLSKLETLFLEFERRTFPKIHSELRKIAERKVTKKLSLIFRYAFIDSEVLRVLRDFDQLTHLDLQILFNDEETLLEILSTSLEQMKQLEDLKLIVNREPRFKSLDILHEKINNLEALRHVYLDFKPVNQSSSLVLLQNLFAKPIKLQSLYLSFYQISSAETLSGFTSKLESSLASLQKLKIRFLKFSPDQQSQELIIKLLQNLCNIQVLDLPGLEIHSRDFLDQIAQTISLLKSLRELHIQEIGGEVTRSEFVAAIEVILQKRGLEKFECKASRHIFRNSMGNTGNPFAYLERDYLKTKLHRKNLNFEKVLITQGF